ncbi:MAG: retroviral-like aspartic protease family protein [Gammaproteobacteria bacterium]|nr:retroviral-like aspartic protease family protein [Gammaproteobacteria bacterium]
MRTVLILCAALCLAPNVSVAADLAIQVMALFENKAVVLIDGKRRLLNRGAPSPEGVVLIEADSRSALLEIGGQQRRFELGRRIATNFDPPAGGAMVRIWPTPSGMFTVNGSINGFPVSFLVDTGATYVAMNRGAARRLGIDYLVEGVRGRASTANGVVDSYAVKLDKIRVGSIQLRDVDASVIDGDHPTVVLLGNSFLNRLNIERTGKALIIRERNY